jgi:hypothetical protein
MRARRHHRSLAIASLLLVSLVAHPAFAEGEGEGETTPPPPQPQPQPPPPPPPPPDTTPGQGETPTPPPAQEKDAWDKVVEKGIRQEGRLTGEETAKKEKADTEEAALAQKTRESFRIGLFAGFGGAYGFERQLENGLITQMKGWEAQAGVGIRKGINLEWEFQTRALFTLVSLDGDPNPNAATANGAKNTRDVKQGIGGSLDAVFRLHVGGVTKPFYIGFGARGDVIAHDATRIEERFIGTNKVRTVRHGNSTVFVEPLGVLEFGVVMLDSQRIDFGIRICGGMGFHGGAMLGVSF